MIFNVSHAPCADWVLYIDGFRGPPHQMLRIGAAPCNAHKAVGRGLIDLNVPCRQCCLKGYPCKASQSVLIDLTDPEIGFEKHSPRRGAMETARPYSKSRRLLFLVTDLLCSSALAVGGVRAPASAAVRGLNLQVSGRDFQAARYQFGAASEKCLRLGVLHRPVRSRHLTPPE
jgi:hypothetical protein